MTDKPPKIGDALSKLTRISRQHEELREKLFQPRSLRLEPMGPEVLPQFDFTNPNHASEFHWRLICWINEFHKDLGDEWEVGGQLVSFGGSFTFTFTDLGYHNPSLISFKGIREDGSPIELVQHVSQINVLLVRHKRTEPDLPKRPIGFASWSEYESELARHTSAE